MNKLCKDYLAYTFLITIMCWGLCVICSFNGILLNENYFLYIPYALGGLAPTIASFFALKKFCHDSGDAFGWRFRRSRMEIYTSTGIGEKI